MRLNGWIDMGKSTHSSGNGAGGNFVTRCLQTAVTAGELGIECGELQAEGRWFGVDSMTAADSWCALEFMRRKRSAVNRRSIPSSIKLLARVICTAIDVKTSDEVIPW